MIKTGLIFIILAFIFPGCNGDRVKPSADSLLTTEAFSIIESVREAYEEKNAYELKKNVSSLLADNIIKELSFESADLSFTPRMVRITDTSVKVNLAWRGTWALPEDRNFENRGVADLVLHRDTMKLTFIEGDNPFIALSEKTESIDPVFQN